MSAIRLLAAVLLLLLVLAAAGCGESAIEPKILNMKAGLDDHGRLVLTFETNLPDGTALDALIMRPQGRRGLYMAGGKVEQGKFAGEFTTASQQGLPAGGYIVQVAVMPNQLDLLGEGNGRLSGPGVTDNGNLGKGFVFEQAMELPEVVASE